MPIVSPIKVYRGEDIELRFSMTPQKDITGWVISLTVSKAYNDQNKLFQLTAFATDAPHGKYTVIIPSATLNIHPGTFVYDVFRVNPGNNRILNVGPFEISGDAKYPT